MAKPYSADLRARVLAACARAEAGRTEIARRFEVAEATLYTWLKQDREEGRREAKPHAGGPAPTIEAAGLEVVGALVEEANAATLAEYVERYAARAQQRVSVALIQRRADVPDAAPARPDAQKKTLRAEEQARADVAAERAAYEAQIHGLNPADLVFIDEAGVTTHMTRSHARAPKRGSGRSGRRRAAAGAA
jgi:transposase